MNNFGGGFWNCKQSTIGGVKDIWVGDRSDILYIWHKKTGFTTDPLVPPSEVTLQYGIIRGLYTTWVYTSPGSGDEYEGWIKLSFNSDSASWTQTQKYDIEVMYDITATFEVNEVDIIKRDQMERLARIDSPCFIFRDYNDRFWFLGESQSVKFLATMQTDNYSGTNKMICNITATERYPLRELSKEYVDNTLSIVDTEIPVGTQNYYSGLLYTNLNYIPIK